MFDLNRQIQAWRTALSQAPTVLARDVDELETHLRDTVAKLCETGLSDEEAFWVASHRLGPVEKLASEFGKINGEIAGWKRAWWMLLGYLVISLSVSWVYYMSGALSFLSTPVMRGYYGIGFAYFLTAATLFLEFATIAGIALLAGTDAGAKFIHRLGRRLSVLLAVLAGIVALVVTRIVGPLWLVVGFAIANSAHPGAPAAGHVAVPVAVVQNYIYMLHSAGVPLAIAATLFWLSYRHRKRDVVVE